MYAKSDMLDELIIYLAQQTTPEVILAFQATDAQQARFEDLMDRSKTNGLNPDETSELDQFLHFNRLVTRLKTQAAIRIKDDK
jgi:hypothetical protein